MAIYARIQDGIVAEVITSDGKISSMFHHSLVWIEVDPTQAVTSGWQWNGSTFSPPSTSAARQPAPSLQELQAELGALEAELGQGKLSAATGMNGQASVAPDGAATRSAAASQPAPGGLQG
jgi:hypothetical protein